jgi:nitrite reductase/ring-hydroxylating ferredoxin subunit
MISRRSILLGAASGFAAIGLTGLSQVAANAAKTYTVCKTSAVPVKGGKTFKVGNRNILITQPKQGTFRAFVAACTHQGGALSSATNNEIVCPLHGAKFNADSGSTTPDTAQSASALKKVTVTVSAGSVRVRF